MTLVSSEILGYIVQYWKILDPEVCQFVNLAIRRFGQFFRFITALNLIKYHLNLVKSLGGI